MKEKVAGLAGVSRSQKNHCHIRFSKNTLDCSRRSRAERLSKETGNHPPRDRATLRRLMRGEKGEASFGRG